MSIAIRAIDQETENRERLHKLVTDGCMQKGCIAVIVAILYLQIHLKLQCFKKYLLFLHNVLSYVTITKNSIKCREYLKIKNN